MATNREISALYDNVTLRKDVPSTYAEAEAVIGEAGGLLQGWLGDTIARNFLPRLYSAASKELEANGFKAVIVKTEPPAKEGEKGKDIYETSIKHCGRYWEQASEEERKAFAERLQTLASDLPIWAAGDRSGTGKIPEWATETANSLLAAGDVSHVVEEIEASVPGYKVSKESDGTVTGEALARGLAALAKYEAEQAQKKAKARFAPPVAA